MSKVFAIVIAVTQLSSWVALANEPAIDGMVKACEAINGAAQMTPSRSRCENQASVQAIPNKTDGRTIFEKAKCTSCHVVGPAAGWHKSRAIPNSMTAYLLKKESKVPSGAHCNNPKGFYRSLKHPTKFQGNEQELLTLVHWIQSNEKNGLYVNPNCSNPEER